MTFNDWWEQYRKFHPVDQHGDEHAAIRKTIAEQAWNAARQGMTSHTRDNY